MRGGGPGTSSRGRGKFKKFTRGGGKHFSRDLRPVDADGNEISMWSEDAQRQLGSAGEHDDESDEEQSDSDSDQDGAGPSSRSQAPVELSREERRREKKARKEAALAKAKRSVEVGDLPPSDSDGESGGDSDGDDDDHTPLPANPNHSRKARAQLNSAGVDEVADGVAALNVSPSRREREAMEAQLAKERQRKLQEAGKTEQAKADLARLQAIRQKREEEAARKKAEREEKEAHDKARRAEIEAREAKRREAALGPKRGKKH